ncbi:Na(+)/H(+) antiporter subunit C [Microbacterium tumbae]
MTLIVIMAVLFACGVYAMLERSLTRVLIGFLLLGNATNLLLLIVMGVPGSAPFFGTEGTMSDPLPQALTLTAIVITFAVSAFLLALIYRSWQLGQADTVEDDEADIALRERTDADEDVMDDEGDAEDDEATTDFVGVQTAPITVLHMRDHPAIQDDAPMDMAYGTSAPRSGGPDTPGPVSAEDVSTRSASPSSLNERGESSDPSSSRSLSELSSSRSLSERSESKRDPRAEDLSKQDDEKEDRP